MPFGRKSNGNNDSVVWLLTTLAFFVLIPVWIKRRLYFISAGIMFFSPAFIVYGIGYYSVWPWVVSFPGYLFYFSESWELFFSYVLPVNMIVGVIFWAIAVWRKI